MGKGKNWETREQQTMWLQGLRLGGNLLLWLSSDLPRPRLICALDGGGPGGKHPFLSS